MNQETGPASCGRVLVTGSVGGHEHVQQSVDHVFIDGSGRQQAAVVQRAAQHLGGELQVRLRGQLTDALGVSDPLESALLDGGQETFVQGRPQYGVSLSLGDDRR